MKRVDAPSSAQNTLPHQIHEERIVGGAEHRIETGAIDDVIEVGGRRTLRRVAPRHADFATRRLLRRRGPAGTTRGPAARLRARAGRFAEARESGALRRSPASGEGSVSFPREAASARIATRRCARRRTAFASRHLPRQFPGSGRAARGKAHECFAGKRRGARSREPRRRFSRGAWQPALRRGDVAAREAGRHGARSRESAASGPAEAMSTGRRVHDVAAAAVCAQRRSEASPMANARGSFGKRMGDIVAEVAAAQVDRAVRGPRLRVALEHPSLRADRRGAPDRRGDSRAGRSRSVVNQRAECPVSFTSTLSLSSRCA